LFRHNFFNIDFNVNFAPLPGNYVKLYFILIVFIPFALLNGTVWCGWKKCSKIRDYTNTTKGREAACSPLDESTSRKNGGRSHLAKQKLKSIRILNGRKAIDGLREAHKAKL
jgi:hypothetical protein